MAGADLLFLTYENSYPTNKYSWDITRISAELRRGYILLSS